MGNRKRKLFADVDSTAFYQSNWLSKIVAFFVPFIFISNLYSVITKFGFGIVSFHSYILAFFLFLLLFYKNGSSRLALTQQSFRFVLVHVFFMFTCLCSVFLVSGGGEGDAQEAFDQLLSYGWMSLLAVGFVVTYRYADTMLYLAWGVFSALVLVCFFNVYEFLNPEFRVYAGSTEEDVVVGKATRISGLYRNQNNSARAIVFSLFVVCYFVSRRLSIVLILLAFFPVLVTFSRAGIVGWGLLLFIALAFDKRGRLKVLGVAISLLCLASISYLFSSGQLAQLLTSSEIESSMNENMLNRVTGNVFTQDDSSSDYRRDAALQALNAFADNPLFGVGLGGFKTDAFEALRSHNTILQLASELGIVGIMAFVFFVVLPFAQRFRFGVAYSLLIVFFSLFTHTLFTSAWFAICTAIVFGILPFYQVWHTEGIALPKQKLKRGGQRIKHRRKRRKSISLSKA